MSVSEQSTGAERIKAKLNGGRNGNNHLSEHGVFPRVASGSASGDRTPRGRVAVVRHCEYFQPHPRRDIFALRDAGFEVEVFCDSEEGKPHYEHVDGVTVIRLPIRHKRGKMGRYLFEYLAFPLLAAGALAMRSIGRRYDYVEIDTMPTWLIVAAAVPKLLGSTVVLYMFEHMAELTATDRGLTERDWLIRLIDGIEMACVRWADAVLTPAERNRELYIERGIPAEKIVFVPNCPDEGMFLPPDFLYPPASEPLTADRPFRLVTHGSLLERYGIQILIEAVASLSATIPAIQLDIIGSGEFEPELKELARERGLENAVNFVGPVPFERMASRLIGADLGVGPYLLDLLPNKMMEYLLLGIPAVAADWPTMRRYFADDAVTYVRPNDVDELAKAIERLYRHPEERRRQAEVARERYLSGLAWSRTRHDYLSVYGVESPIQRPAAIPVTLGAADAIRPRRSWLGFVLGQSRGPRNALTRLPTIVSRFGLTPRKSAAHLDSLLSVTDRHGVTPTLFVTGVTARRSPDLILDLQRRGVEIGAHGFVHNDYSMLTLREQMDQVGRARDELAALGLRPHGWRCPYSRSNQYTLEAVAHARLEYDATPVYEWPAFERQGIEMAPEARADYERLCRLFGVRDAAERAVLPSMVDGLVQIPMSIPQDEDMIDRLHLSPCQLRRVWLWMVGESRRVSEAFVICLHPERAELMADALDATLGEAKSLGDVWTVPLVEVANWWRERSAASVSVDRKSDGRWTVTTVGSDWLVTRFGGQALVGPGCLTVKSALKPVIGMSDLWPKSTRDRIQECGYVVETCGPDEVEIHLDSQFDPSTDPEIIVRRLTESGGAVRLEPWPAGFRSCLSVTGDIDAVTLFDFAMRLKEFS